MTKQNKKPRPLKQYTSDYTRGDIYSHTKDGVRYYEIDYNVGYNRGREDMDNWHIGQVMSVEDLMGLAAQGYCTKRNENKVLDPDLLVDICKAIHAKLLERHKGD